VFLGDLKRLSFVLIGGEKEVSADVGDTGGQGARVWSPTHMGSLRPLLFYIPMYTYPRSRDRQHRSGEGNCTKMKINLSSGADSCIGMEAPSVVLCAVLVTVVTPV